MAAYRVGRTLCKTSRMSSSCVEYVTTQMYRLESRAADRRSRMQGLTCLASVTVPSSHLPFVCTEIIVLSKSSAINFTPFRIRAEITLRAIDSSDTSPLIFRSAFPLSKRCFKTVMTTIDNYFYARLKCPSSKLWTPS